MKNWFSACLMTSTLFFTNAVSAQFSWNTTYEATRYMPGQELATFNTLAEAEAWIRQEPSAPRGNQFLVKVDTTHFGDGDDVYNYKVRNKAHTGLWGDYYTGHVSGNATACNSQLIPFTTGNQYGCNTEADMLNASLNAYPLGGGGYTGSFTGSYLPDPPKMWSTYAENDPTYSYISVNKNANENSGADIPGHDHRTVHITNGFSNYQFRAKKIDIYRCPVLFEAEGNPFGLSTGAKWPLVCRNLSFASIRVKTKQHAPSCAINTKDGNPCLSDTGNKEYREKDFDWEGISFARTYNSVADMILLSGFGNNWAHSFSDRLVLKSNLSSDMQWIRSDGYYENLRMVDTNTYKSAHTPGLVLYRESDAIALTHGRWRIAMRDGKQLWFGETGRLQRSEQGGQTLTFAYCNDEQLALEQCPSRDVLVKVISSSGRSLDFEYASISVPVGTAGTEFIVEPRLLRISSSGQTLVEYVHDVKARLTHASFAGTVAGEGREYLYAEAAQLCRNFLGTVIANCNAANYPNHMTGVIDEKGTRFATYTYDEKGRVTSSEHAGAVGRVSLDYQSTGNVEVALPTGARKTYQFNTTVFRQPTQVTIGDSINPSIRNTLATYSGDRIATLTEPNGARSNYIYNTFHLVSRTDGLTSAGATTPQTRTTQTDWHALFNVPLERRVLNAANVLEAKTTYAYNPRGQTTAMCQIDPSNPTAMSYVCGSNQNAPTGVRQSTMTYCEPADVTAGTCPIVGLLLSSDGARSEPGAVDVVTYTYYQNDAASCATAPTTCPYRKGDLWKVTNALNQVSEYVAYDGAGRALQMKDANNVITDMEYHPRGWLTYRKVRGSDNASETDDAITRMDYDATGQVIKVTQPDGDFVNFTYDAAHRLTGISDALNNSITYTLDNAGNRTAETTKDPSNVIKRSLSRVYDTLGRLQISKNAANAALATLTYDANDNLNTSTDGLNRITDQDVDSLNRLIKTIQDQGAGKINATTQFEYDARDNLTKVIDPKNLNTVYSYNGLNDLTQLSSPDTGNTTYTYDSAGNRKTQTDARNITSTYDYDVANRLVQVSVPTAAQNVYFDYDATQADCQVEETYTAGRLARIRDESGSTRYCYNRLGQPVRKVQSITGGPNLTLGSTYNAANRMVAMTYPSGAIVTYLRNAKGQITNVSAKPTAAAAQVTMVSNVTYLPFGPLNTLTFANGRVLTKAYDQNYDIDKVSDNSTTGLSQDSTVNVIGNITAITERTTATANTTRQFAYDNLDRLLSLKNGATNIQSFTYDATGNRLNKTLGTTVTTNTIAPTSHRLTQDGSTARTYDANGNSATIGVKGYVYDDLNRLRDYKATGNTVTRTYRYNGKGERVSKVQSAGHANNRYYFYDEAGHLLGEYLANGTRVQEYVWLDDQLVAVLSDHDASTYQFVETDHLGTPRAVVHPVENNIVWRWNITNTAFGEHTATNNPDGDAVTYTFNLRYPGQYFDSESTLHYNYFRDYEPQTGRYVQSDPIGLAGGLNTYGYVTSNPLLYIDPFGLVDLEIPGTGTSFHGNPGPGVTDYRAEHGPAHVHLGSNSGPHINIRTFEPFSPEDAKKMTPEMKKACSLLTNKEKNLIRKRAKGVFKRGFFFKMVGSAVKPSIAMSPLLLRKYYDEYGGSAGLTCEADPNLDHCPAE